MERGREQPPDFDGLSCPEDGPGVAHAPVSVPRTSRALSLRSARRLHVRCRVCRRCRSRAERTALSTLIPVRPVHRPSHDQRRAVLDVVKALAALDPAGFGLDDACAQLEGSTYVMAEEARCSFSVLTRAAGQTYREDLVGAIAHPLRSRIRCGALQPPLSEQRRSSFNNPLIDRATLLARSLRRLHVTRIAVGVTPASALHVIGAPAPGRRA